MRRWSVVLLATAAVAALAVASMWNDSATADEPAHIVSGLIKVREGEINFYAVQPPLMNALVALPLAASGVRPPAQWQSIGNRPWVLGYLLFYRSGHDSQRLLRLARLPVIALLLALCVVVYAFVWDLTGNHAAALAALLLAGFCPTLVAHGRLATVDLGLSFFAFAAVASFLRLLRKPSYAMAVACGAATGCALATKVSGALLVPFLLLVAVAWA
ncbi:MAG TPA: phospholipid carrier-dependent glycosyltransferase, partial [Thermoanaerobaculia bacterium]|nr:phospholipid carrier-dependent glycosyltransferase [Thermoanaerobaculia bacterium]